jgi:NADPH:quinone reductase-like Zn-dependent oxidoreductase
MKHVGSAVVFDRYGDVDELRFVPQEMPEPGDGELVVEVIAAAVNHMENYIRRGDFADEVPLAFPARQGSCFAGIVRRRGKRATRLPVGADVLGHAVGGGAHATYVVVPETAVVPKPEGMEWEVAGGLYLAGVTAMATMQRVRLTPEDVVVVTAAAGGVGHIEVQLARAAGATVIGTGSAGNADYLRSLGAIPVVYGDGLEDRIRAAAKGRDVTAFIDNHGSGATIAQALKVPRGRLVTSEDRRALEVRFFTAGPEDREPTALLEQLVRLIQNRTVRVLVSGFYPFEYVREAFAELDQRHARGKVILGMRPSAGRGAYYLGTRARAVYEAAG